MSLFMSKPVVMISLLRPEFFYFLFCRFFSQQVRVGGHGIMFPSILIQLENGPNEFYFYFTN